MMPFLGHKLICPRYPSRSALATVQRKCRHAPAIGYLLPRAGFLLLDRANHLKSVQPVAKKFSAFLPGQISCLCRAVLSPKRGRPAVVTNVGQDAVVMRLRRRAPVRVDERRWSRTAKSCGPDAPTLASSS